MRSSCVNAIIYLDHISDILIIKRRDVPVWVLPGGMIEPGECPEEAIVREVFEETGCNVSIDRKVGVYYPVNRLTATTHVFLCQIKSGTPRIGDETREIDFFSVESLPDSFFHIHKDMIDDSLNMGDQEVYKPLSQVTYLKLFKYFLRHPFRVIRFALSQCGLPINS